MINYRIFEHIEPQDVDNFLQDCTNEAKKLGINLEHYIEEYVIIDRITDE
jgi:hypothetical protein